MSSPLFSPGDDGEGFGARRAIPAGLAPPASLSLQPLGIALAVPIATVIGVRAALGWGAAVAFTAMAAGLAFERVRETPPLPAVD